MLLAIGSEDSSLSRLRERAYLAKPCVRREGIAIETAEN